MLTTQLAVSHSLLGDCRVSSVCNPCSIADQHDVSVLAAVVQLLPGLLVWTVWVGTGRNRMNGLVDTILSIFTVHCRVYSSSGE